MPLEATMMIIDNSEYMRNGDYGPTRFDAQSDAVNSVFQAKIDSNPENTVGIMTMAGKAYDFFLLHLFIQLSNLLPDQKYSLHIPKTLVRSSKLYM